MDLGFLVPPTPVDEISEDGVSCAECKEPLADEAYFDGEHAYYCEECMDRLIEKVQGEAEAYAEESCKITAPLPKYDPEYEYRCPPEDYEMGERESYTPNAHMCHCRHECTNYDALIKPLGKDGVRDQLYYLAISERITELLEQAMDEMDDEVEEDDDLDGGV